MKIGELPKCNCQWCSSECIGEGEPLEYLLECSGPFDDSREMHGLVLLVLQLQTEIAALKAERTGGVWPGR